MRPASLFTLTISILLIVFFTSQTYSQSFFKNGYIVVASGDTLGGELRERSSQLLDFRAKPNSPVQNYTPEQLIGYQAEDGTHLAVILTEEGRKTGYFMHDQIKGYVSLYSLFKSEGRLTHAIRLPDKTFVPLRGNLALLMLTNNLTACTDPNFTRLLNSQSFIPGDSQFERIVKAYNACVNPSQSVKQAKKPFHYEVGLSIGAVQNSWKYYKAKDIFWDPNGVYGPSYTAAVGGFFTIVPRKRLSVSIEILYTQFKGSRVVNLNNPNDPTVRDSRLYSFSENYLALPITGRYVFINGSVRWYVKAGVVPTLATAVDGSLVGTNINAPISFQAGIGIGYLAGLGAEIRLGPKRHLYVEARTMPHLVNDEVTHVADSRSIQLMVSIPLFEH